MLIQCFAVNVWAVFLSVGVAAPTAQMEVFEQLDRILNGRMVKLSHQINRYASRRHARTRHCSVVMTTSPRNDGAEAGGGTPGAAIEGPGPIGTGGACVAPLLL